MKSKTKFISIVLFLSVLTMLVSFSGQKAEWKGKIEIEDGAKVIKNPGEPLYGEIKFELEEDLSIGREDDDNYLFYRVADIQVDQNGNIYVVDFGNYRVQKFDRNGNYLQTIGRKGQGPGEFESPLQIVLDSKTGNIYVIDGRLGIKIFDNKGNYLNAIKLEYFPRDIELNEDGNILGILSMGYDASFVKLNSKGKIKKKIANITRMVSKGRVGNATFGFSHGYEHDIFMSKIDNQTFIYGCSKEYEINVVNREGNLLYKIKKDEPYIKFPQEEKRRIEREARQKGLPINAIRVRYPSNMPFFHALYTDSKGRIYVQRTIGKRTEQGPKKFNIFSKDGYYLYNTIFPYPAVVIKDGYFYTRVVIEKTGEEFVKRFKIKNWEKIKEKI